MWFMLTDFDANVMRAIETGEQIMPTMKTISDEVRQIVILYDDGCRRLPLYLCVATKSGYCYNLTNKLQPVWTFGTQARMGIRS